MNNRMAATGDFWAGLGFAVFGSVTIYGASQVFVPPVLSDILGPRAFPLGLSWGLLILGLVIMVRAALIGGAPANVGSSSTLAVATVAAIGYVLAFQILGYILSTALFLCSLFLYLGERRHWLTAAISLGVTATLYLGFGEGLHVQLPVGPLGF